jgi:formylglycine-generating enzyme required for sulfatase activity
VPRVLHLALATAAPRVRISGTLATMSVRAGAPNSAIRWLQVADLHLGARSPAEVDLLLAELVDSLARRPAGFATIDLLLVSGDLTRTGSKAEFAAATRVLERILAALPGALIIPVPGNHDVRRPDDDAALAYGSFDDYDKGEADRHVKTLRRQLWEDSKPSKLVERLFGAYQAWFADFVRPCFAGRTGVVLHESVFPGDLRVELALPGKPPMTVVGLNSAWRGYQEAPQRGHLTVAPEQLARVTARAQDGSPRPLPESSLLVMHHPPDWLSPPSRRRFESDVYQPSRFLACLHGHAHGQPLDIQTRAGGLSRIYLPTPSLLGHPTRDDDKTRSLGYTLGELADDGALRVWPMRRVEKADGVHVFEEDRGEGGPHWTERGVLVRSARPTASSSARALHVEVVEPAAVKTYREWLLKRDAKVDLIGVAGGEMALDLDAIYVALRVAPHDHCEDMPASDGERQGPQARRGRALAGQDIDNGGAAIAQQVNVHGDAFFGSGARPPQEERDFEVDALFHHIDTRHALLLGHPGSGKTTALQKLLHRVAREGAGPLGLLPGTVPVWLPLRHFSEARKRQPLAVWLADELAADKDPLPRELGAALVKHGRLLLLADGLDEVAHEPLRIELCQYLQQHLPPGAIGLRAIVSSRYAGYRGDVRLHADFTALDLRPLGERQVEELVTRWFEEAPKKMPSIDPAEAKRRAARLIEALRSPIFRDQRRAIMKSTPLLLTLVCVIVNSGREMPSNRVAFYEECLKVMLGRWGKETKEWKDPPLDLATATAIVRRLAYTLHSEGGRDDLPRATLVLDAAGRLRELRKDPRRGQEAIQWLHVDAGVLREFAAEQLGFFHLGMQEYLAAASIGAAPGKSLDALVAALDQSWWHEVARLLVSLPGVGMFEQLVARLLERDRGWPRHVGLIHQWIDESPTASAAPLVAHVNNKPRPPEGEVIAVLGILDRFVGDAAVQALAAGLDGADSEEVRLLAQRLMARQREQMRGRGEGEATPATSAAQTKARPVALLFRAEQRVKAERLARALETRHVMLRAADGGLPDANELTGARLGEVTEQASCVVVIADEHGPAFAGSPGLAAAIAVWATIDEKPLVGAWLGGERPGWPEALAVARPWVDVRAGDRELSVQILRGLQADDAPVIVRGHHFTEPVTGVRFLWVPGGRFQMGQKGVRAAEPVHGVRLSPYWLAETPVTNAQYQRFLVATGYQQPGSWQDERFVGDTRPVVGVSWDDAVAFCAWLSEQQELRTAGVKVLLPSEAQWEFAARGTDGRTYSWPDGSTPDDTLAIFGREGTAPVGSCPKGQGPFGHGDLIGNVWEWCRDVWNAEAYQGRNDVKDPVQEVGGEKWHPVRGGSWAYRSAWAAAVRDRFRSDHRDDLRGFRVAAVPASR